MDYAYKLTTHGRAAMAAGLALDKPLPITRVAFGSGRADDDAELADIHALLAPVSDGEIAARYYENERLQLTLQYANSQHPGVPTFQLWEFMVFCIDPKTGTETDFLYATLGDYPQTVPAYSEEYPPCVFNFPLTLIISNELSVSVDAPAGLATFDDLSALIDTLAVRRMDFAIPVTGWTAETGAGYAVRRDIPVPSATEKMVPFLTVLPSGMAAADACGLAPFVQTLDGVVRVFARRAPSAEIAASLALAGDASGFCAVGSGGETYVLQPATAETLGGVKIGEGVGVTADGLISIDSAQIVESAAASDESTQEMLDKVFGTQ